MKVEIYLGHIHRKYHNTNLVYDTDKEIEGRIELRFRLPKIITWARTTKLSMIVGILKALIRAQSQSQFILAMINIMQQNQEELTHGSIQRSYGKLEPLRQKKPDTKTTSLPTSKL